VDDQDPTGTKLRQRGAARCLGRAFGDAAGAAHEFVARNLKERMEPFGQLLAAPARLAEDARVLRPHGQDAIEGENQFRMVERAEVHGEASREALGIA